MIAGLAHGERLNRGGHVAVALHQRNGLGEAAFPRKLDRRRTVENLAGRADSRLQTELNRGYVLGTDGEVEKIPAARRRRRKPNVEAVLHQKPDHFHVAADHRQDEGVSAELRVKPGVFLDFVDGVELVGGQSLHEELADLDGSLAGREEKRGNLRLQ